MYISLKWLQNVLGVNEVKISELSEKLNLGGFEIEEIMQKQRFSEKDFIINISLTANRDDLFNFNGLKLEIMALILEENKYFITSLNQLFSIKNSKFGIQPLFKTFPSFVWERILQKKIFKKNVEELTYNSSFFGTSTFFLIQSKKFITKPSSIWLQKELTTFNIAPINNIYDALMLSSLETGYPFFCLDVEKLQNYLNTTNITFTTRYTKSASFLTSGNSEQNLLLLFANNQPISVIGLLTLKELEIDMSTKKIFVYGGIFDSLKIRKSSRVLGVKTHQSICLEKNLNLNSFEQAYLRVVRILKTQGVHLEFLNRPFIYNKLNKNINFFQGADYIINKKKNIYLRYKEIKNILGPSNILNTEQIQNIILSLNLQIVKKQGQDYLLSIPFSRQVDLEKEIDIIEELARVSGFKNFKSILPNLQKVGHLSKLYKLKQIIRNYLIQIGFNEVINYTLGNHFDIKQIELKNALLTENSYFRTSLLNEFINKATLNKKQNNDHLQAFEIGRVYNLSNKSNVSEQEFLSGIFVGNKHISDWINTSKENTWFEAKGFIEELFLHLSLSIHWSKVGLKKNLLFHPGRCAELSISNINIGIFGQIHPLITKKNNLPFNTYLFEFNLEQIKVLWRSKNIYLYQQYSNCPSSFVDLAYIVPNTISYQEIQTYIYDIANLNLEDLYLFDYYSGDSISKDYHSLGFKLKFKDRTLTKKDVENIVKQINESMAKKFNISYRV
jgi:phenylalanyl-tRNA synthetase beta chain